MAQCTPDANPTKVIQNPKADIKDSSEVSAESASPAVRVRPADLGLIRSLSKSDSDLLASPLGEEDGGLAGRSGSVSNCKSGQPSVERMSSFASEWDEIEKIMNLIGAGIETSKNKQPTPSSGNVCEVIASSLKACIITLCRHLYSDNTSDGRSKQPCKDRQGMQQTSALSTQAASGTQRGEEEPDGACGKALDQPVGEWLEHVGLPQYESKFLLNGFDDLRFMVKALGCDGSTSLVSWLDGLGLHEYLPNFLSSGYRTLECVKNLWELEIVNVIKIGPLGHRKRIIASLAERPYEEAPTKSRRLSPIMFHDLLSQTTSPLSQMDPYTSRSMDMLLPLTESDRRRRGVDQDCSVSLRSYSERPRSVDRQSERHKDSRLNLRPPSHSATYATVSAWHHQPEKLILDSCGYEATYLGSMIIRDLRGIESTQDACAKIRKSKDSRKGPVVILSITYRGVKFIDAATKTIVAEHEIRNISCAAQDPDDLCTFAYITKDLKSGHHFCHVFSTVEVTQTYEIILTLGQAFEVAYQMAIQSRARQYVPPSSLASEVIETKTSRPVSQSWSSMRRSAIDPMEMDADMQSLGSTTWLLDQRESNRRPVSTKYETTIF
ncbi:hypothetical protein PAMA_010890 [Pampus argenteus]